MRRSGGAAVTVQLVLALCALLPALARAEPASGPREDLDQTFTATKPGKPTGLGFSGSYHAPGDPNANPPYMRRMVFFPPKGMRYDTSVPDRCTATDIELEVRGPDACPDGSRIGKGTTEGIFYQPIAHAFEMSHYKNGLTIVNNANEQIMLVESEGWTVARGHFRPDGSVEFASPTCFPAPPAGQCVDDYVLQLRSATTIPAYTKRSAAGVRSYATTPPTCPKRRYWQTRIRFWWADGSVDTVAPRQPCTKRRR